MSKLLAMPSSVQQIASLDCDGVMLGIEGLSINMPHYFKIEDVKNIENKEIFIVLNKNMHNSDISFLKETLLKLKEYPIQGVFFYDLAFVHLKQTLNLSYPLIWSQEHMTNNYATVLFWKEQGVIGSHISNDITLREMKEIRQNTDSLLFVNVFGYLPIFTSQRHFIENYQKTFHISSSGPYKIEKEGKYYPIIDDTYGTVVYSDFLLNGLKEMLELQYDYYILNSFQIESDKFIEIVSLFKHTNLNNIIESEEKLNQICPNSKKGFFYEETVYKVK